MAGCTLTHVLTTHHHHDHAGGNWELCRRVQLRFGRKLVVVGGKTDSVPACTLPVSDGQSCEPRLPPHLHEYRPIATRPLALCALPPRGIVFLTAAAPAHASFPSLFPTG